jgi:UDP-N-acetylmuramoyl-L-alanyl-D-glutamate--2,6-diaminopimelate ligase
MFRRAVKAIIPDSVFKVVEPYGHGLEAILANIRYGFPARGMNIIGVTGTDGKTTTSTLIYTMLNESGIKTGLMTTIGYGVPENWHENYVHMTTVSSFHLIKRIVELKAEGIEWLVLETTSHALAQNRVLGIPYSVAVMTNVTHEHLDYHGTIENYREAKIKLFRLASRNRRGKQAGIINADDPAAKQFAAATTNPITYGEKAGDVRAGKVISTAEGNEIDVRVKWGEIEDDYHISSSLPGDFNVYNALAAAAVGEVLELSSDQISKGIGALKTVEGRMNSIKEGQDFSVIVDFAHTPDSFEQILSDLKALSTKRLIVVFGSAGRRDEAKRAIQGGIAGKYADIVVVTEEDDRDVNGLEIMDQIAAGAEKHGKERNKDLFLVHDRVEAIQFAIDRAKTGDTVVFLGKGHEKTIERADGEHPWDEPGEVRKALKKRHSSQ